MRFALTNCYGFVASMRPLARRRAGISCTIGANIVDRVFVCFVDSMPP